MDIFINNLEKLQRLKTIVNNKDAQYFTCHQLNRRENNEDILSIVMTAHNRSKQVYFTLKTIENSSNKNIQVIIVDDSTDDHVDINKLADFSLWITVIIINNKNKFWVNPCVNYNIGFSFIEGSHVIIQNSEVCHVGDVCSFVKNTISEMDNKYLVFDVRAVENFEGNEMIYNSFYDDDTLQFALHRLKIYRKNVPDGWYQHSVISPKSYHFLSAISKKNLDNIGGFSFDYFLAGSFDDDDLVLKIKNNGIKIVNINNQLQKVAGIHLFHRTSHESWENPFLSENLNGVIFQKKVKYVEQGLYIEISDIVNTLKNKNTIIKFVRSFFSETSISEYIH